MAATITPTSPGKSFATPYAPPAPLKPRAPPAPSANGGSDGRHFQPLAGGAVFAGDGAALLTPTGGRAGM